MSLRANRIRRRYCGIALVLGFCGGASLFADWIWSEDVALSVAGSLHIVGIVTCAIAGAVERTHSVAGLAPLTIVAVWSVPCVATLARGVIEVGEVGVGYMCGSIIVSALLALGAYGGAAVLSRRHPGVRSNCLCCGYDLRGNASGACPECGTTVSMDSESVEARRLAVSNVDMAPRSATRGKRQRAMCLIACGSLFMVVVNVAGTLANVGWAGLVIASTTSPFLAGTVVGLFGRHSVRDAALSGACGAAMTLLAAAAVYPQRFTATPDVLALVNYVVYCTIMGGCGGYVKRMLRR